MKQPYHFANTAAAAEEAMWQLSQYAMFGETIGDFWR